MMDCEKTHDKLAWIAQQTENKWTAKILMIDLFVHDLGLEEDFSNFCEQYYNHVKADLDEENAKNN